MPGPYRKTRMVRRPRKTTILRRVKALATKVNAQAPELKYAQQTEIAGNSSYDGTLRTVSAAPAQGNTDTSRVGDSLKIKNIEFRMTTNSTATTALRVIIFIDKRNFSSAVTDFLESGTIGIANSVNAVNALKVHDYSSKYRVLYDKVITVRPNTAGFHSVVKNFHFKNGLKMEFLAGATTVIRNAVKMIYISANSSGFTPAVNWQARTNFYDA